MVSRYFAEAVCANRMSAGKEVGQVIRRTEQFFAEDAFEVF